MTLVQLQRWRVESDVCVEGDDFCSGSLTSPHDSLGNTPSSHSCWLLGEEKWSRLLGGETRTVACRLEGKNEGNEKPERTLEGKIGETRNKSFIQSFFLFLFVFYFFWPYFMYIPKL